MAVRKQAHARPVEGRKSAEWLRRRGAARVRLEETEGLRLEQPARAKPGGACLSCSGN